MEKRLSVRKSEPTARLFTKRVAMTQREAERSVGGDKQPPDERLEGECLCSPCNNNVPATVDCERKGCREAKSLRQLTIEQGIKYGSRVAQLVERWRLTHVSAGSSPVTVTILPCGKTAKHSTN